MNKHRYLRESKSFAIIVLLTLTAAIAGCGKNTADTGGPQASAASASGQADGYEQTEIRYLTSPNTVIYPELAADLGYLAPLTLKDMGSSTSGPESIQTVVSGDVDFGGAFNGAIVKLVAAGAPIKAIMGYYGEDEKTFNGYYVLEDSPIQSARDLIGKKIAVNTLGAHHEFMIKEYLTQGGLTKKEIDGVTLVVTPPLNGEQALRQKQVAVTTLGGVLKDKAVERGGIRPLFTDQGLYGDFTAGSYVMTTDFLIKNPRTVHKFVEATAKAIEWARNTPQAEVVARFQKIIKERDRNEDPELLKYWKSTGITGKGGLMKDEEFTMWLDGYIRDGKLKKGQVDVSKIYTNEFNPFATESQ